jgi:hypothetical protein
MTIIKDKPKHNRNILSSNQQLNIPWKGILEYQILKIGEVELHPGFNFEDFKYWDSSKDLFTSLYKEILIKDHLWHYIWEGSWTVLRISKKFKKKVERFFEEHAVVYMYRGEWGKDEQCGTANYQKVFTYLFHGFSVLSMESSDDEIYYVLDRVYHIFNLSNIYRFLPTVKKHRNNWESHLISEEALERALYVGLSLNHLLKKENL